MLEKIKIICSPQNCLVLIFLFFLILAYANLFTKTEPPVNNELSPPQQLPLISLQILNKLYPQENSTITKKLKNPFLTKQFKENDSAEKKYTSADKKILFHLQGTIINQQEKLAIISINNTVAAYRQNDFVAGYTIKEIDANSVTIFNKNSQNLEILNLKD